MLEVGQGTTFKDTLGEFHETVIGDEKQSEFFPRAKIKTWDNECNFSIGLDDNGGIHTIQDGKVTWEKGDTQAIFYTNDKPAVDLESPCEFIQLGSVPAIAIPQIYEQHEVTPTVYTYQSSKPALMFFSTYEADEYVDYKMVDIPMVRAASSVGNPYYMDDGLPMIDFHIGDVDQTIITPAWHQALKEVLKTYGVTSYEIEEKGAKTYVKEGDKDIKISSPQLDRGHFWTYLNLNCDYNKAYTYYKDQGVNPNDTAYGLQAVYPDKDFSGLVEAVVRRWIEIMGMPVQDTTLGFISNKNDIHESEEWVRYARRDDCDYFRVPQDPQLEFEIVLETSPVDNIVPLTVTSKELEFIYQPALTSTEALTAYRPPYIVGGVVAYHKTKQHNQYKAGKAFEIHRPIVTDSDGEKHWCDFILDSESRPVGIKVPVISYPAIIDPTFGYATAGASSANYGDSIRGSAFTGLTGYVQNIGMLSVVVTSLTAKTAIYRNSDSVLIKQSNTIAGDNTAATRVYTGFQDVSLVNISYDLVGWTGASAYSLFNFDAGATNQGLSQALTYTTNFPATGTFVRDTNKYTIYATVEYNPAMFGCNF